MLAVIANAGGHRGDPGHGGDQRGSTGIALRPPARLERHADAGHPGAAETGAGEQAGEPGRGRGGRPPRCAPPARPGCTRRAPRRSRWRRPAHEREYIERQARIGLGLPRDSQRASGEGAMAHTDGDHAGHDSDRDDTRHAQHEELRAGHVRATAASG